MVELKVQTNSKATEAKQEKTAKNNNKTAQIILKICKKQNPSLKKVIVISII